MYFVFTRILLQRYTFFCGLPNYSHFFLQFHDFVLSLHTKITFMAQHNDFGKWGEEVAAGYLREKGYTILHRNYRVGHRDLDIVALKNNILVFVEVKTRKGDSLVEAEKAVDRRKIMSLNMAANNYLKRYRLNVDVRFDIVAITGSPADYSVNHMENAFLPIPIYR